MIWQSIVVRHPDLFCDAIETLAQKDALLLEYKPQNVAPALVAMFKRVFPWHYNDTQRAYTQPTLRKRGNRGKREDFAYFNRATKYFGYDQFEAHRTQPNKMICLWNPANDGDMVGEHNPCLVTVRFKEINGKLDLIATYRKRDVCRRMIGNMVFLSLWLNENAARWKCKPGKIVDFSMETQWKQEDLAALRKGCKDA